MGYVVQRDLSLQLFGEQAGLVMIDAISEESRRVYLEPVRRMQILCGARGHPGPNALDVSSTISDALTVSCISEGFDETGRATDRHPGAWFDRFSEMFALTPTDLHENPLARPVAAVDRALAAEGLGDMLERIAEADEAIVRQQLLMAQDLMCNLSKGPGAAVLVATEIAADFHEMQSAVTRHHDYHDPIGYARLLLAGELTGVYVILRTRGGTRDFRTPSHIPSNHVGAFRAAAQSAKQMDRLAAGFLAEEDFVDKELLEQMLAPAPHGLGLNLQLK
jgi:hypothetical protein